MFTGLVETMGEVRALAPDGPGSRLTIAEAALAPQLKLGDSVAVNGVCLTVIERDRNNFAFQVGPETLRCTNLGELTSGSRVNLERSLAVGDRLGGHIVQGHVDGVGRVARRERQQDWEMWVYGPQLENALGKQEKDVWGVLIENKGNGDPKNGAQIWGQTIAHQGQRALWAICVDLRPA